MVRALVLFGILALTGCDERPRQWDAYISPHGDGEGEYVTRGFKTFELCQTASMEALGRSGDPNGYYECGYRCGPTDDYPGADLCAETRD